MNPEIEQSLHLFRVLARAHRSVAEHSLRSIKSMGLHPTEFAVLELLYNKGPQPLGAIASRLLLVSGGVTYVVDKMERSGLLYRKPCETDRRVTYACLTEKGRERMEAIFPQHAERIHEAVAGLTPEEKETLIGLLKKMGLEAERRLHRKRDG